MKTKTIHFEQSIENLQLIKSTIPQKESPISNEVLLYIIQAGIQAPSGDNVQPWLFEINDNCISLFINREIDHSYFNVQQVASLISNGAVIQNMIYAAGVFGLKTDVELFPNGENNDKIAQIYFIPTGNVLDNVVELEKALWKRCTNRRMYSKELVKEAIWGQISDSIKDLEGITLFHNKEGNNWRNPLSQAVYLADRVRAERRDLHEYLIDIIRFKAVPKMCKKGGEIPTYLQTGMPLRNLQAGLMGEIYMRTIRSWSVMRIFNAVGIGRSMPIYGLLSVLFSGGIGMICIDSVTETSVVKAGYAIERIWCELERLNIAFQPLAAIPLLTLRLKLEGESAFSPAHVSLLKKSLNITKEQFNIPDNSIPVFMFRIGKSAPITQRTYRQKPETLLCS